MSKEHRAEVFAWTSVVRAAFEGFSSNAREVPGPAVGAVELVEAWLNGREIASSEFQAAADLCHEEGVAFTEREKDRALAWIRTAAGNLAWYAKKDRGWQNEGASIRDAAVNAVSCLGRDGNEAHEQLTAIYEKELASAPVGARGAKKKSAGAKKLSTNFSAFIGLAANRRLAKLKPVFDLAARGDEATLRVILSEQRYAIHAAVLAYDARYGGLMAADAPGEEGNDWIFGAHACLRSGAHVEPRGNNDSWVPVAYSPNDCIFFMDDNGAVWVIDTIGDVAATRFAESADEMMTRIFMAD